MWVMGSDDVCCCKDMDIGSCAYVTVSKIETANVGLCIGVES